MRVLSPNSITLASRDARVFNKTTVSVSVRDIGYEQLDKQYCNSNERTNKPFKLEISFHLKQPLGGGIPAYPLPHAHL